MPARRGDARVWSRLSSPGFPLWSRDVSRGSSGQVCNMGASQPAAPGHVSWERASACQLGSCQRAVLFEGLLEQGASIEYEPRANGQKGASQHRHPCVSESLHQSLSQSSLPRSLPSSEQWTPTWSQIARGAQVTTEKQGQANCSVLVPVTKFQENALGGLPVLWRQLKKSGVSIEHLSLATRW